MERSQFAYLVIYSLLIFFYWCSITSPFDCIRYNKERFWANFGIILFSIYQQHLWGFIVRLFVRKVRLLILLFCRFYVGNLFQIRNLSVYIWYGHIPRHSSTDFYRFILERVLINADDAVGKKYQNGGKSIKSKSKVMKERVDILRTTVNRESTLTSCVLRQQEEIRIVIIKILYIFVK